MINRSFGVAPALWRDRSCGDSAAVAVHVGDVLQADQAINKTGWTLRYFAKRLPGRAFACIAAIAVIASLSDSRAASDTPIGSSIVWSASLPGIPRLCDDGTPAIIYMKYDLARKTSSVLKHELNGEEHLLGEFSGSPDPRSLSCSQDGQTIVALGDERSWLFVMHRTETALYRLARSWPFSNAGRHSFLAPDGKSLVLGGQATLMSGPDILRDIEVVPDEHYNIFFTESDRYVDRDKAIYKYRSVDGHPLQQIKTFKLPPGFDASEIIKCGDHDVASLVGVDSSRYMVLEDTVRRQDWLEQVGVRKLFRQYNEPFLISGGFGVCGFPLLQHTDWYTTSRTGASRLERPPNHLAAISVNQAWRRQRHV